MADALAASILDLLPGLALGPAGQEDGNRLALEGVTLDSGADGTLQAGIRKLEASSLRLASGPLVLEVERATLLQLMGQVRVHGGRPHLRSLEAASADLSGLKLHGPLAFPREAMATLHAMAAGGGAPPSGEGASVQPGAGTWCLGPLAGADGLIRAEILDAHLLFDADVTVPIRRGQVDFNAATVEHVGPDSRMGVSRLGIYVDAANGRSYLYQFPSAPVGGVDYERRGALLGPWVTERGRLHLQPFAEGLLRQGLPGHGQGLTEQARQLFDRTAVAGDVQLGDGRFAAPGVQADFTGSVDGRNAVRMHSEAVGRRLTAEMASLSLRHAMFKAAEAQVACDELTGALLLQLFVENAKLRFAFELANMAISGLRLQTHPASRLPEEGANTP